MRFSTTFQFAFLSLASLCNGEVCDTFLMTYGDKERPAFGIERKQSNRLLHAVESAEKKITQVARAGEEALVHAVRDEVELLFCDKDNTNQHETRSRRQNEEDVTRVSRSISNGWGLN